MKTLIIGLLAALGLVNTTDAINPKELGSSSVEFIPLLTNTVRSAY